ncbi:hypothetical protein ASPCAL00506 [Aspergillus calidoustus]|uniref:TauD/TfdA-like domain-containing protein n=1 Tax=Aspergillus calidoustus TaxID=454130 RepID=A0A0U5FN80_ASPCI|nr:hypothetical protein ASPCAL00506 [Aspergillus calidoustus]
MRRFSGYIWPFARSAPVIPDLVAKDLAYANQPGHVGDISQLLDTKGIVKVTLNFKDESSDYLRILIRKLHQNYGHGLPIRHSASRGWFWDVRPTAQRAGQLARSETTKDFPWHTDCSYESSPPRFFALHVLQHDRCGGGTLSVMNVDSVSQLLSPSTTTALCKPNFRIATPPEFTKDNPHGYIVGSLLLVSETPAPNIIRFREDIVTPLNMEAANALTELKKALKEPQAQEQTIHFTSAHLPSGSILLIDNYRWLHMRDEVKDKGRHLRRVRWNAMPFY